MTILSDCINTITATRCDRLVKPGFYVRSAHPSSSQYLWANERMSEARPLPSQTTTGTGGSSFKLSSVIEITFGPPSTIRQTTGTPWPRPETTIHKSSKANFYQHLQFKIMTFSIQWLASLAPIWFSFSEESLIHTECCAALALLSHPPENCSHAWSSTFMQDHVPKPSTPFTLEPLSSHALCSN